MLTLKKKLSAGSAVECWVWWHRPAVSAVWSWRSEDNGLHPWLRNKFKGTLEYMRPWLKEERE